MTLTDCQLLSIVAQLGTFAAAAERLHITPSAVSHAVSGVEAECGFPLFTRTKSGVTLTAAAEKLMPAIQQMLASSESLDQSIAQINGMHKGALRLGVFNSACVTWLPLVSVAGVVVASPLASGFSSPPCEAVPMSDETLTPAELSGALPGFSLPEHPAKLARIRDAHRTDVSSCFFAFIVFPPIFICSSMYFASNFLTALYQMDIYVSTVFKKI